MTNAGGSKKLLKHLYNLISLGKGLGLGFKFSRNLSKQVSEPTNTFIGLVIASFTAGSKLLVHKKVYTSLTHGRICFGVNSAIGGTGTVSV